MFSGAKTNWFLKGAVIKCVVPGVVLQLQVSQSTDQAGLEIATDTGAFATKIFAFATKICRQVANLRPVCCRSFGHMLATGDYFKPKLIKEYHIEESCVLFINKKSKSSGKILLNLP